MRLTRNTTPDGKCKYAIVRLDKLRRLEKSLKNRKLSGRDTDDAIAWAHLEDLKTLGLLEYGEPGTEEEFFVIKLKDMFAPGALHGYRSALWSAIGREKDKSMKESLLDYFDDLQKLEDRATSHPSRKRPD